MLEIIKRTSAGLGLLIILPLLARFLHWYGPDHAWWSQILRVLTLTSSWPWVIVSQIVLCGWFVWCLRLRWQAALPLCVLLCLAVLVAQGGKRAIKSRVTEPLPAVVWQHTPAHQFYQMPHLQREALLDKLLANGVAAPRSGADWQKGDDRAFPSGHTAFAALWFLLAMGILSPRRHSKTQLVLLIWAVLVMLSRLLLNMSWPRDLLASILLAWLISSLASWLILRFFPVDDACG